MGMEGESFAATVEFTVFESGSVLELVHQSAVDEWVELATARLLGGWPWCARGKGVKFSGSTNNCWGNGTRPCPQVPQHADDKNGRRFEGDEPLSDVTASANYALVFMS